MLSIISFKMMQHLNSCSTFCFESGVSFILLFTLHKNCLLFLCHIFLAFIVIPRNACLLLLFWHPFWEFSLFLFAPYTNIFCSSVQITVMTAPTKCSAVNRIFVWILKILLSLVCLLELSRISIYTALQKYLHSLKKFHYPLKTKPVLQQLSVEGLGTST
jgi:hypothetical protein